MSPLVPLEDVQASILDAVVRLEPVTVPLPDALGAVLAAAVVAPEPVPPFPNTAMDGYALRAGRHRGRVRGRAGPPACGR